MKQLLLIPIMLVSLLSGLCLSQDKKEALTNDNVISLVKAGLSNSVIRTTIQNSDCKFDVSVNAIIDLKKRGVPDDIIEAMMTKGNRAPATNTPGPVSMGTLSEDKKTYVTSQGVTFHVGDPIKINVGSNVLTGSFKYITKDQGKIFNAINDAVPMNSDYAQQVFVIKEIYSARSSSNDMFIKNAPRTVYLVVEPVHNFRYRIAIEAALGVKEVVAD